MSLETLQLEHVPTTHKIYAAFFRDLAPGTAAFLQSQLVARNADFEYAFIDASSVVSRAHVLAAVFSSVMALLHGALRTPNVHSEIVASLSTSNNIAEAYRRYGITPETKDVIIVKVLFSTDAELTAPSADGVWAHLQEHVKGTAAPLADDIKKCTDMGKVRKYYKLNGAPAAKGTSDEEGRQREMEVMILSAMALRGL